MPLASSHTSVGPLPKNFYAFCGSPKKHQCPSAFISGSQFSFLIARFLFLIPPISPPHTVMGRLLHFRSRSRFRFRFRPLLNPCQNIRCPAKPSVGHSCFIMSLSVVRRSHPLVLSPKIPAETSAGRRSIRGDTRFFIIFRRKIPKNGGERGIRTPGTRKRTAVFETAPFDHSGISPVDPSPAIL